MIGKISDVPRIRCRYYGSATTNRRNDHVSVGEMLGTSAGNAKERADFLRNGEVGIENLNTSDVIRRESSQKRLDGPGAGCVATYLRADHRRNNDAARATPGTFDQYPQLALLWRRPSGE